MPPVSPASNNILLQAHEDRISGLEDAITDFAGKVATLSVHQETTNEKLDTIADKLDTIADKLGNHSDRLTKLESDLERSKKWKKAIVGLLLAGAGVLVEESFKYVWKLITHQH